MGSLVRVVGGAGKAWGEEPKVGNVASCLVCCHGACSIKVGTALLSVYIVVTLINYVVSHVMYTCACIGYNLSQKGACAQHVNVSVLAKQ